jgi:hypothetical protein
LGKVVVIEHLTLDGVMQAPGRPEEDDRDGFEHGGWAHARVDAVMGRVMGEGMARGGRTGRRLFADGGAFAELRLTDTTTTTTGVVIAKYQANAVPGADV